MSTAMVEATGAAKARMQSSTMIAPWNSRRRQWVCSASLIARCMMLGTGFRVAIVFSGNPPGFDRPFAAAGAHILRGGVAFRTLLAAPATGVPLQRGLMITASIHRERPVAVTSRPFRILGIQQIALGSTDKSRLRRLWVDLLGLRLEGSYRSERENVDEDIAVLGRGPARCEIDLMQPIDAAARPTVHEPALNHLGLWVDNLPAAVQWLAAQGVRFAPGGVRRGAAGHDVTF